MGNLEELVMPTYYVVSRTLTNDQAVCVLDALKITPVFCSIISDPVDVSLALSLSNELIRTDSSEAAFSTARNIGSKSPRPPLVVGEADLLEAVYADGRREKVACSC